MGHEAVHLPLSSVMVKNMALYFYSPICLYGVVLGTTLPLYLTLTSDRELTLQREQIVL